MKNILIAFLAFSVLLLNGASLPQQWSITFCNMTERDFTRSSHIPPRTDAVLKKSLPLSARPFNLDHAADGRDTAFLRGVVKSPTAQRVWLGTGCKIFALFLNGKLIYDFRKYGLGNNIEHVSVQDHKIPLQLAAGDNELVFLLRRTNRRQDYCYGKDRKILWDIAVKILKDHRPVKAALAHPELFLRPDENSVMVSFVTTEKIPAGIDYRPKGSQNWTRIYDTAGELILREKSRIHRIKLEDLKNCGDIEYRLVLLEPPAGRDGFRHPLWTDRIYKEVYTPVKVLRNPDRKEFSMFFFGDTQLSLSENCKTVKQRDRFMSAMRSFPEYRNADIITHLGDTDSFFHDVEQSLLADLLDKFAPGKGETVKPWILVRGNHETNGLAAESWFDHFQMPGDKSYYSLKIGEVLFIVLDCGDVSKASPLNAFNGPLQDLDHLFRKQSRWLEQLRRSKEFREARFRVVLSHSEPQISRGMMAEKIRTMCSKLLEDDSDSGRIHLWIAGHVHRYWRAARNSKEVFAATPIKGKWAKTNSPVNWVSVDGPKGDSAKPDFSYLSVKFTPEAIAVRALDENGKKFDEFTVTPDGKLQEIFTGLTAHSFKSPVPGKKQRK